MRYPNTSKLIKKNSAAPRFFNPPLSVWISDETLFLVFDILLTMVTPAMNRNSQHGNLVVCGQGSLFVRKWFEPRSGIP